MDRFDAMNLLLKVLDAGSLSAASRQLDIPLPTVSRHLAELEARIGAKVVVRSSRKLTLTEVGVTYVEGVRHLLDQLRDIELAAASAYSEPKGTLSITAPIVMGRTHLVPLIAEFVEAHPQIDIKLVLSDHILAMTERQFDVALRVGHLPDSALIATEVGSVRRVAVASPAFLAQRGVPQVPEDLTLMPCVTFDNLTGSDAWRFQDRETMKTVPIHSRLVANTAESALLAAEHGMGFTRLLSYQVADSVANDRTRVVLSQFEMPPWPVSVVYQGQTLVPRKLVAFLNHVVPRLRGQFAAEADLFSKLTNSKAQASKF